MTYSCEGMSMRLTKPKEPGFSGVDFCGLVSLDEVRKLVCKAY
jgi:hypothetical protein